MATHEKLQKSLEALKILSQSIPDTVDGNKKKEKIQYCYAITEAASNPTIRISTDFHRILGTIIETFLKLTDDPESDVRMTAEECLNRIIRATNDGYIGKIQIELHKEIKKNGATRTLRTALWLFSVLAHHIRPHKGKPYVTNLFPNLINITDRHEESVHETLALSLPKILKVLSCFTTENEMKALLKAFLKNIGSNSAVIRRTTTTSVLNICLNCRKPSTFLSYCLTYLLDLLIPICDNQSSSVISGVLSTIKTLIPHVVSNKSQENELNVATDKLLQVFELCLHYLSHSDHNIVNVSLETLQVLIHNCDKPMQKSLLCERGWGFNRIISRSKSALSKQHSPSELSIATNMTAEDSLFSESELTETIHSDIDNWIDGSRLSVINTTEKIKDRSESLNVVSSFDIETEHSDEVQFGNFVSKIKCRSVGDNLDSIPKSDDSSDRSLSESTDEKLIETDDIQEIDIGDLLHNDLPIIYCTRLITTQFLLKGTPGLSISDKAVRVSVKHLALLCLSSIFQLYPAGFFLWLDRNYSKHCTNRGISSQNVSDIFLFKNHSDPQLRGAVRNLIASLIKTITHRSEDGSEKWLENYATTDQATMLQGHQLVDIFVKGLEDESSTCIRQTLLSLDIALPYLLESKHNQNIAPLLEILPLLAYNPYWLVKVTLCELVAKMDYASVFYLLNTSTFQQKVIFNVLFELLDDGDLRVRNAAAVAIREIIPRLYFEEFKIGETAVTSRAIHQTYSFLKLVKKGEVESNINEKHFIENMPFPFNRILETACDKTDFSLSKIIYKLCNILTTTISKHLINGCIETLSLLSDAFPCTVYRSSWGISNENNYVEEIPDLLKLCISYLLDTDYVYDIQTHIHLLKLSSNLYAGHSAVLIKPLIDINLPQSTWSMFVNKSLSQISEQYLTHSVSMLNIFHHVLNDMIPTVQSHPKNVLSNLPAPGSLSPMKRRKSDLDKKLLVAIKTEKDDKTDKKDGAKSNSTIASFCCSTRYLRVFDILKTAFVNYKISLDSDSSQKFLELLVANLRLLSVLMEIGTINEFSGIAEDILNCFRSTFTLDAPTTVRCVEQLLKCLFGTNLTVNISELSFKNRQINRKESSEDESFYFNVFQKPYNLVVQNFSSLSNPNRNDLDNESTMMGYLHRKGIKRGSVILLKSSDKILANYIRIFEPMVIKSLKQYTVTSDVNLQCQVLQLLNQLVRLRVNYCLLDSEQVFIGFVLKQFEFIEEGQIPLAQKLIPKIFQFLVQLSYSRQHSKSIIGIPKIIQLCDGLMASGQPSSTHCIPALQPLVEDIFLSRNKSNTSDIKELETTREVVLSMLLRLWEDRKVMDLITLILEDSKFCTDNSEKWFDWSRRVFAVVFPVLRQNKLKLENLETLVAMKRLILMLHSEVFKPFDEILGSLFQDPPYPDADLSSFNNWLSKINILLLIIIPVKEDVLITKIDQLKSEFSANSIYENVVAKADPLNVYNNADTFGKIQAETVFVRMIFRVISLIANTTWLALKNEETSFIAEQFSVFLLYCICLFQFGSHCRISNTAVSVLKKSDSKSNQEFIDISEINKNMLRLSTVKPLVTFYWTYLISLLNYNDRIFYSNFLVYPTSEKHPCINSEIAKTGCLISLCDYLCDNLTETGLLQWFLTTTSPYLIEFSEEGPVSEFITFLHRNSKLSTTFLKSIRSSSLDDSVYKIKLLKCVEHCHASQTGQVLKLLIPNLLKTHQEAVSRQTAILASRKIELLLTMPSQEVLQQFSKEDLMTMRTELVDSKLIQKHEALVSLLNKLGTQYFGLKPVEFEQRRVLDPNDIRELKIDRKWYLGQIQHRFSDRSVRTETTQLLDCLEYNDIFCFMNTNHFNKSNLKDCLKFGLSSFNGDKESALLRSSIECIFKQVGTITNRIDFVSKKEPYIILNSTEEFNKIFIDEEFIQLLNDVATCVPLLLSTNHVLELSDHLENLLKFAATSLEYLQYILKRNFDFPVGHVEILLTCANAIFKEDKISSLLNSKENLVWFSSSVDSLFYLVEVLLKFDKPSVPNYFPVRTEEEERSTVTDETESNVPSEADVTFCTATQAVHRLYILVCWFTDLKCINRTNIPQFLFDRIRTMTISLSRLSIANSYMLVPLKAWKTGWTPESISGTFRTQVPAMPIEILQDVDVLKEYILRVNFLGWTSRQQFEETWMGLLSIFCYPLDNMDTLELNEILHSSSLAIKSITSLLLTTLTCSDIGNPVAKLLHVSRNASIPEDSISTKKLRKIQDSIEKCYDECSSLPASNFLNVFKTRNLEKLTDKYGYGQLGIKYFLLTTDIIKETKDDKTVNKVISKRRKLLEDNGLDLNSCLQFLLDYYTQLMKPQTSTHIRVLHEAIRSTVIISDLFMDKSQFSWMMNIFLELSKMHTVEDELLHQYLIVGICKAVSILNPEMEIYDHVKKMLTQYLKSPYLSSRMACLYGLLYLLEGCKLNNISIGGISDEMQLLLTCAVEYIQFNLNPANSVLKKSQEHFSLVWSLAFYLLENIDEGHMEQNFVATTLNAAFNLLIGGTNIHLHQTIFKGLERLLIIKKTTIIESYGKQYLKLALEKIKSDNPTIAIMATQLLLSYLYTDCEEHLKSAQGLPASPDHLVQTIEKISAIFERIKKGYVHEVEILCYMLPNILNDFFSPSDVLTKVIGEFLSPQQPHPKLLSKVVFQVFESAIKKDQLSLLQDWVVFSLSNFTQSFSIGMATWCLTCFFISASSNPWLRSYFPYVQTRVGRYEYEDRKMLCIAGADFYNALTSEKQKTTFVDTFSKVKDQPDTPFNDLLLSL